MLTLERASELVQQLTGQDKIDLFVHFENVMNPFNQHTQEEQFSNWQIMFATMCGFLVTEFVDGV